MITWQELTDLISKRQYDRFYRSPEVNAAYGRAKVTDKTCRGSTANYVKMQLGWEGEDDLPSSPAAEFLGDNTDVKILVNRFPYEFEPSVIHLVVWSRVPIPIDADTYVSEKGRAKIEEFIENLFVKKYGIPRADIAWFKNPTPLQTIPTIAHFHVLLRHGMEMPETIDKLLNDTHLVHWQ